MRDLKILGIQSDLIWDDPQGNRELFRIKIMNHCEGHHLILLPETFTTGFPKFPHFTSETLDGDTIRWMGEIAEKTGAVICGSLILERENRYTNTLVWVRPDGSIAEYDKRHVFSMASENEVIDKGRKPLIIELNGWKIMPMICYDLRFPVWSKNTMDDAGNYAYDLAIYIANWPAIRSYPWQQLLIARAIENLSYVAGINRVGRDPEGIYYSGDSMIIDPEGQVLSKPDEGKERILSETLSYEKLEAFRSKFNVGKDWDTFSLLPAEDE
ncbi:MAG: amidohydrolase [bacterium]|jgi:omega-amidase